MKLNVIIVPHLIHHSSSPVIQKVGNFVLLEKLEFEKEFVREMSHFNCNSKQTDVSLILKMILLLTVSTLFPFEAVQNANIANFVYCGKTRLLRTANYHAILTHSLLSIHRYN